MREREVVGKCAKVEGKVAILEGKLLKPVGNSSKVVGKWIWLSWAGGFFVVLFIFS